MVMFAFKRTANVNSLCIKLFTVLGLAAVLCPGIWALLPQNVILQDGPTVSCPEDWDPSPCSCFNGTDIKIQRRHNVLCKNIGSSEELQTIFSKLKQPTEFDYFGLVSSSLKLVPAGVFGKAKFVAVVFFNNSIEKIEPGVFQGMEETLTVLYVGSNRIKIIDFVSGAQALTDIFIEQEPCEQLADYALANLLRLRTANFEMCALRIIGHYAFANTSANIDIHFSTAAVTTMGDYVFSNHVGRNVMIKLTNITDNSLSTKTFADSYIRRLTISGVTRVKEEIFSPLLIKPRNKIRVSFKDKVKCDQSTDWVTNNATMKKIFRFKCEDVKNT